MIIRNFRKSDLCHFIPSKQALDGFYAIGDFMDAWEGEKKTFVDGDKIVAFVLWDEYDTDCYIISMITSVYFKKQHGKFLRNHYEDLRLMTGMKRLQTDCFADLGLQAWHKFMGFQYEGKRIKMINGRDIDMWGRVWE